MSNSTPEHNNGTDSESSTDEKLHLLSLQMDMLRTDTLDVGERFWVMMAQVVLATYGFAFAVGAIAAFAGVFSWGVYWDWVPVAVDSGFIIIAFLSFFLYAVTKLIQLWIVVADQEPQLDGEETDGGNHTD